MAVGAVRRSVTTPGASRDPPHSFRTEGRPITARPQRAFSYLRRPPLQQPAQDHLRGAAQSTRTAYGLQLFAAMPSRFHRRCAGPSDQYAVSIDPHAYDRPHCSLPLPWAGLAAALRTIHITLSMNCLLHVDNSSMRGTACSPHRVSGSCDVPRRLSAFERERTLQGLHAGRQQSTPLASVLRHIVDGCTASAFSVRCIRSGSADGRHSSAYYRWAMSGLESWSETSLRVDSELRSACP